MFQLKTWNDGNPRWGRSRFHALSTAVAAAQRHAKSGPDCAAEIFEAGTHRKVGHFDPAQGGLHLNPGYEIGVSDAP